MEYPLIDKKIDEESIAEYLEFRYPISTGSFYLNINHVKPGCLLIYDKSGIETKTYWSLPVPNPDSINATIDKSDDLYKLMESSVKYRMIADVPITAFISGGIDSTIVTGLMSKQSDKKIKTYTTGFQFQGGNEFKFAKIASDRFSTSHEEIYLREREFNHAVSLLSHYKDGPIGVPNEAAIYLMCKEIKKYGKVVLSGEGADEFFGGYGKIFRSANDFEKIQSISSTRKK